MEIVKSAGADFGLILNFGKNYLLLLSLLKKSAIINTYRPCAHRRGGGFIFSQKICDVRSDQKFLGDQASSARGVNLCTIRRPESGS
jgi:hypothetical protein